MSVPWTKQEDEKLGQWYQDANGAFHTYKHMAYILNKEFHSGKKVRNTWSIRRREKKIL